MSHRKANRPVLPSDVKRTLTFKEIKGWHKLLAAIISSLVTYLVWRLLYQSQMDLPYPAELTLALEAVWGALVGLGPFLGLAVLQTAYYLIVRARESTEKEAQAALQPLAKPVRDSWICLMLGALGGLAGGIAWRLIATSIPFDSRTLTMTALWSIVYTNAILLPLLTFSPSSTAHPLIVPALTLLPVVGFLVTRWLHIAPDQADVDMSVGLWLRIAIAIGGILISPTSYRSKQAKYHATGEQIKRLQQAVMQQKQWLTKGGTLIHLSEELAYSPAMIRKLCSGERRPSREATRKLLQIGKEAGLDRAWGHTLLETTHHFSDQQIAEELNSIF